MRKLILNLHLWGALIGGIFLIILGATGGIIAFQPEVDHLLNRGLFHQPPATSTLDLDAIQAALAKSDPKIKPYRFVFPAEPTSPYIANTGPTQYFINSQSGEIIGSRPIPSLVQKIRQLHTGLMLGKTGHIIVQIATWLSLFLIVSGLYLWWPLRRTGKTRGLSFYLHLTFGIYSALFLLTLTVTGLVIAYDEPISAVVFSATHSSRPKWNASSTVIEGATPITAGQAVQIALKQLPGAIPFAINLPGNAKGSYHIGVKYPGGGDDGEESGWVLVDQFSGAVLFTNDPNEKSPGQEIMNGNGGFHTGQIFGLPSKIVLSISSFVLVIQTITGYLIWWRKLRKNAE